MADYDAIVIGTGQAGPALARRLVTAGWKVAIIERKLFGGTCINTDQDADRERLRGASYAPCCRVWRGPQRDSKCRHEGSEGAQGCRHGCIARGCRAVFEDVEGMYGL